MRPVISFALSIPIEQILCFVGAVIGFAVLLTHHKDNSESMAAGRLVLQQEESLCQLSSRFSMVASITREVAMTMQSVWASSATGVDGAIDARFSFELDPSNRSVHRNIFATLSAALSSDESIEYVSENFAEQLAFDGALLWTQSACLLQFCFRGYDQLARVVLLPPPLQRGGLQGDNRSALQAYFESSSQWDLAVPFNISGTGEAIELTHQQGLRERWTSRAYSYLSGTSAVSVAMARLFCLSFLGNQPLVCQHAIAVGINLLTASSTLLSQTLPSADSAATVIHIPSLKVIATTISPFALVDESVNLWPCDATPSPLLNSAALKLIQYCMSQQQISPMPASDDAKRGAALLLCAFDTFVASQFGENAATHYVSADRLALDDGQVLLLLLIVPRGFLLAEYDASMRFVISFSAASFSVVLLASVLFGISLRRQVLSILVVLRVERKHIEGHTNADEIAAARLEYRTQCSANVVTELAELCNHSEALCQRLATAIGLLPPSVVSLFRDESSVQVREDDDSSTTGATYLSLGNTVVRSAVPTNAEGQLGSLQVTGSDLALDLDGLQETEDTFLSDAVRAIIEADGAMTHTDEDDDVQLKPRNSSVTNGPSSEGSRSLHPSATASGDVNSTDSPQLSSKDSASQHRRNRLFLLDGSLVLRRVTCMSGNMENFLQVFLTPEDTIRAHSIIVETIVEASSKRRGMFDSFHGDRFFISFNAAVTCANQVTRAVETFLAIKTKLTHERSRAGSPAATVVGGATVSSRCHRREKDRRSFVRWGFASGVAMCGYLGNAAVRRLSVVGRCVNRSIQLMNACKSELVQTLLAPEVFKSCEELFLFQHVAVLALAPEVDEEGNPLADKGRDQGFSGGNAPMPSSRLTSKLSLTTLQLACTIILFDSVPERIVDVSNSAFEVLFNSGDEPRARDIAKDLPLGVAHRLIKAARTLRDHRKKLIVDAACAGASSGI